MCVSRGRGICRLCVCERERVRVCEREREREWGASVVCVCVGGGGVCQRLRLTGRERGGVASFLEDVPLIETPLCTLYLHACLVRVTVGDSGLCC